MGISRSKSKTWFEKLFGESEFQILDDDYFLIHQSFDLQNEGTMEGTLYSHINQKSYQFGKLDLLSLGELRKQATDMLKQNKEIQPKANQLSQVNADVKNLHAAIENQHALFQVASQFNLLEMMSFDHTPEEGIEQYQNDNTQGPACAMSAAAGTMYRNYFMRVNPRGKRGQTQKRQVNTLSDFEKALGIRFKFKNGYVFLTPEKLSLILQKLEQLDESKRNELMGFIKYGIQWNTQVTSVKRKKKQLVQQIYCSALPIGYGINQKIEASTWKTLAVLILDAVYEATLLTAIINQYQNNCSLVYLTYVGGGHFKNDHTWIQQAIERAFLRLPPVGLDIKLVKVAHDPELDLLIEKIKNKAFL